MAAQHRRLNYLMVMPRLVQNIGEGYSFPLGITYVAGSLKKAGYQVFTLNLNHRSGDVEDILRREIEEHGIDVIGCGGLSFQFGTIKNVVDTAKRIKDDIITIVGGGIITGDPEAAMEAFGLVDYGVVGEGEETICELAEALEHGQDVSEIPGLIIKVEKAYQLTAKRKEIMDVDALAWPDYEGFELDQYMATSPSISGLNRKNTIFMIASRSCPYNCTFCFHTLGRRYRQRSLENFFEELEYMIERYHIEFVCLADELFARDMERVHAFCEGMKKHGLKWWAQFRVDDITPELIDVLKDGGCEIMSFGLESADNRILESMRKHTTVEQIEKALKIVYDAGISLEGAFIFGDIEETWETANNTLNWWREHAEYKVVLNLITVYPGSYLYQYACEQGIIEDRVQFLRDGCPQINVSKLSEEEYAKIVRMVLEVPMTLANVYAGVEVGHIDGESGRIDIAATCTMCHTRNNWTNTKLFSANFLRCQQCGQRYNVVLPDEIRKNIDDNLSSLLDEYGKVAVWGMNYHTLDLFKHSKVLSGEGIIPVDISSTKRMMDLYGKKIHPSRIIEDENIEAVVIAIPNYFSEITEQIRVQFRNVKKVIRIYSLVEPDLLSREAIMVTTES